MVLDSEILLDLGGVKVCFLIDNSGKPQSFVGLEES